MMTNSSMTMTGSPPSSTKMHMTFYWSKNATVFFTGFPGTTTGLYILCLVFIFVMSLLVELLSSLSRHRRMKLSSSLIRTLIYGVRMGLMFLVMLATMSFNVGVLLAAVAGHTMGFYFFGSSALTALDTKHDIGTGSTEIC
ncbi:Copper transporter [Zostera marina]|uniref:Copper transport protein n=1 Tax=Zostera marina TaxID=29655 RepID=A0A0K9NII8_ZOSMR|nr:Copper transporter [Zostera marina]